MKGVSLAGILASSSTLLSAGSRPAPHRKARSPCLQGFRLIFTFSENPYFSNRELVKTYYMVDEEDPVLEKPEGTQIQWKEGKDPTIKVGADT